MESSHYKGDEGRQYHYGKRLLPKIAEPWMIRLRAEKFASEILHADVVVEFGVGRGWNLAGTECARKIGIDVSDFLATELTVHGIEFHKSMDALPDAVADVAICHHALEHVENPLETLRQMRRLIKPSGKLLLFAPFERERRYWHYRADEPNHHLFSWNAQTLGNLLVAAGFAIQSLTVQKFRFDRLAGVWASKVKTNEAGYRFIRRALLTIAPEYEIAVKAIGSREGKN